MEIEGNLIKLTAVLNKPVDYYWDNNGQRHHFNSFLGQNLRLDFTHEIHCIHCGQKTNKSFSQGFCYPCFIKLPQTDAGVINPELNRAHEGISRDMEWSKQNDLIDHYVYLAVSGDVKVGVTRHTQIPTRWIDQGAEFAIILAKTPYRQLAGLIEVELKNYLKDKTNWRKMLSGSIANVPDLLALKDEYIDYLPEMFHDFISDDDTITQITYPVLNYTPKIKSVNFDKSDQVEGKLVGIKGQYLIFESGLVFNVRKHNGYRVVLHIDECPN